MKRIVYQLFLLGLPLLAFADEQPTFWESFGGSDDYKSSWIIYGHRTNKIAFVIFQTNHGTNTEYLQHIHLTLHTPENPLACEGWIDMPDGTKRDLPSSKMVFEYTDGVFHSAPIDISYDDFLRFLDSAHPDAWSPYKGLTVADLKRFEKKTKAKSSHTAPKPAATLPSGSTNKLGLLVGYVHGGEGSPTILLSTNTPPPTISPEMTQQSKSNEDERAAALREALEYAAKQAEDRAHGVPLPPSQFPFPNINGEPLHPSPDYVNFYVMYDHFPNYLLCEYDVDVKNYNQSKEPKWFKASLEQIRRQGSEKVPAY